MPAVAGTAHERRGVRAVAARARHAPADPRPHAAESQEALRQDALVPASEADHRRSARPAAVVACGSARSRPAVVPHERLLARVARPRGVPQAGALIGPGRGPEEGNRAGVGACQDAPAAGGAVELVSSTVRFHSPFVFFHHSLRRLDGACEPPRPKPPNRIRLSASNPSASHHVIARSPKMSGSSQFHSHCTITPPIRMKSTNAMKIAMPMAILLAMVSAMFLAKAWPASSLQSIGHLFRKSLNSSNVRCNRSRRCNTAYRFRASNVLTFTPL